MHWSIKPIPSKVVSTLVWFSKNMMNFSLPIILSKPRNDLFRRFKMWIWGVATRNTISHHQGICFEECLPKIQTPSNLNPWRRASISAFTTLQLPKLHMKPLTKWPSEFLIIPSQKKSVNKIYLTRKSWENHFIWKIWSLIKWDRVWESVISMKDVSILYRSFYEWCLKLIVQI